jgi:serine/threonine protein kinase
LLHSNWGNTQINTGNAEAIGRRAPSVTRWDRQGNPQTTPFGIGIKVPSPKDPLATTWLNSSDKWNRSFPEGWDAVKVLGSGGYGIAGHWRYTTPGPHQPGTVESEVRDIVVKQGAGNMSRGLIKEAKIMEMLTMTGSRHFPQIYGRVHRDVGQQDRVLIDEKRREVHRIFMEFCEEGSFADLIDDCVKMGDEPDEATLWSYFHCLAKANMVLESGHEQESETPNSNSEPWADGKSVIHFDLKPDNVLMGGFENDGEHMKENRIMIADFGLSVPLPNKQTALEKDRITILNEHAWRGTRAYKAPVRPSPLLQFYSVLLISLRNKKTKYHALYNDMDRTRIFTRLDY